MKNIKFSKTKIYISVSSLLLSTLLLTGCGSDGDSENLARAVKLETQRQNSTIIESFVISGGETRLTEGETHQLSAKGIDSKGNYRDVTAELIWTSSDETIASVNKNTGLVKAIKNTDENQGIVVITATTLSDKTEEINLSVSDNAANSIVLKQALPETGNINTCIDAQVNADVTYQDGYQSLNTTRGVSFSVDANSTAAININGELFTSSATSEDTIITGSIGSLITNQLAVTADPSNLHELSVLLDDEIITRTSIDIGERIQLSAQATLLPETSKTTFNIDNSVSWQSSDSSLIGITQADDKKGTLLALKPGVTTINGNCGGKKAIAVIEVKGEATLEKLLINEGEAELTIAPKDSIKLTLNANYTSETESLNVAEFGQWSIDGSTDDSKVVSSKLLDEGTISASYEITSKQNIDGTVVVAVTYDGKTSSVRINIVQP